MIKKYYNNPFDVQSNRQLRRAFTLAEILAILAIGSIIMVATLAVLSSVQRSAEAVTRNIKDYSLPQEALQRIAEDLDNIIADENYTNIIIRNKIDNGYKSAQLIITQYYYNKDDKKTIFRKITWQTAYDFDTDSLILYRSYTGIPLEDRLLDEEKEDWEKSLFVPLCQNVTYFSIQIPREDNFLEKWTASTLPKAATVTISFAEPFKTSDNDLDVPEQQKFTRTIAIDRTRKIIFKLESPEYEYKITNEDANQI